MEHKPALQFSHLHLVFAVYGCHQSLRPRLTERIQNAWNGYWRDNLVHRGRVAWWKEVKLHPAVAITGVLRNLRLYCVLGTGLTLILTSLRSVLSLDHLSSTFA